MLHRIWHFEIIFADSYDVQRLERIRTAQPVKFLEYHYRQEDEDWEYGQVIHGYIVYHEVVSKEWVLVSVAGYKGVVIPQGLSDSDSIMTSLWYLRLHDWIRDNGTIEVWSQLLTSG